MTEKELYFTTLCDFFCLETSVEMVDIDLVTFLKLENVRFIWSNKKTVKKGDKIFTVISAGFDSK